MSKEADRPVNYEEVFKHSARVVYPDIVEAAAIAAKDYCARYGYDHTRSALQSIITEEFMKAFKLRDNCEICSGSRGGAPGNENIIKGVVMCDYCSSDALQSGKIDSD